MPDNTVGLGFDTIRLHLRTLQPGDEEFLASLDTDPEVMQYIHSGALSRHEAGRWSQAQVHMAPHRRHMRKWIVELRGDRAKIGWIELSKFRGVFDPGESRMSDDVALGYQLARFHWGNGFAQEAVQPVLTYAFHGLKLDRVVAFVRPDNIRSERVLEGLRFRCHPSRVYKDEGEQECRLYALSASDWRS